MSYDAERVLSRHPEVTGVMKGEGEETFAELVSLLAQRERAEPLGTVETDAYRTALSRMKGITYRDGSGRIVSNPWREAMDMNRLPFIYGSAGGADLRDWEHKIIYYESSRGCPFRCSYCLSSIEKKLRFRDLSLVKRELQFFIDHKVPQVKFVDRTFNCNHEHAREIWKYLSEHDEGFTNFHFEVAADLLDDEELGVIAGMRPGLIQLEIGVQSTNPETVREIRRTMDFERVADRVRRIKAAGNVHQHLDLIAGLPFEDLSSFRRSFCDVYQLRPEQLQLGFLKVLKGSFLYENRERYGLACKDTQPYEVLYTKWLSYGDVLRLKGIEEMVEIYYNSGQFTETLPVMEPYFEDAFGMYDALAVYYRERGLDRMKHTRAARYQILLAFLSERVPERADLFRELLTYDYYLRENARTRPAFAGEYRMDKAVVRAFYEREEKELRYLGSYAGYDRNQMRRMTHLEAFNLLGKTVLFDYRERSPITKEARTVYI